MTEGRVLYVIVCGSPAGRGAGTLVDLAQRDGWQVCVVATPDGMKFIDADRLAEQTGYPVRSRYKLPDEGDVLPTADAMIVAPATVNTVNKWAAGIADTLALGLLVEGQGRGVPIVAMPYTNLAMAAHPAFVANVERLRSWGVAVLFGPESVQLYAPGAGATEQRINAFPWDLALRTLDDLIGEARVRQR